MNFIIQFDHILLKVFQKYARWAYQLLGITNFQIAQFCLDLTIFFCSYELVFRSENKESISSLLTSGFLKLIVIIFLFYIIREAKIYTQVKNVMNPFRAGSIVYYRFMLFILALFALPFGMHTIIFFNEIKSATAGHSICFTIYAMSTFFGHCFAAIEPEPPSESKLKRGLKKLKSMFSSNALPQPA